MIMINIFHFFSHNNNSNYYNVNINKTFCLLHSFAAKFHVIIINIKKIFFHFDQRRYYNSFCNYLFFFFFFFFELPSCLIWKATLSLSLILYLIQKKDRLIERKIKEREREREREKSLSSSSHTLFCLCSSINKVVLVTCIR